MGLDINLMIKLDNIAGSDLEGRVKDSQAFEIINNVEIPKGISVKRQDYVRYYYDAKRHYLEGEQYRRGYGHGV